MPWDLGRKLLLLDFRVKGMGNSSSEVGRPVCLPKYTASYHRKPEYFLFPYFRKEYVNVNT
jgi:hypothetical protein